MRSRWSSSAANTRPVRRHSSSSSSSASSQECTFAHPPVSPICRTPLFPDLTFLFFFSEIFAANIVEETRNRGPLSLEGRVASVEDGEGVAQGGAGEGEHEPPAGVPFAEDLTINRLRRLDVFYGLLIGFFGLRWAVN